MLPAAEHYGLGVIPWSPLSGGKPGGRREDDLATLDEIFPGPGGPAPEAYAW